jgi:hypothetical protein
MPCESRHDQERQPADAPLVERLRAGDADAFAEVVRAWSPMMLQVARSYVSTEASAQEVVQEAWLAMIRGLNKFQGWPVLAAYLDARHPEQHRPQPRRTRGAHLTVVIPRPWGR